MKETRKSSSSTADDGYIAFSMDDNSGGDAPKEITLMTECSVPWLQGEELDPDGLAIVQLHNEIVNFCDYCALTRGEMKQRKAVLREVSDIVQEVYPECKIAVFGSMLTKILTPTSDIDMAFYDLDMEGLAPLDPLYRVAEALSAKGVVSYIEVVSAKVPIIKCDHFPSGISFDICLNNTSGLVTGKIIKENAKIFPQLRPLAITLKIFLSQRKLNETYGGGVGSFLLCSMLISFLQQRRRIEVATGIDQAWNLGSLLLDFFRLYGTQLNPYHAGISLLNGGKYFPKRLAGAAWINPGRLGNLAIQNPTEPDTDMGRNSYMFFKVRRAFEHAYQVLYTGLCGEALEVGTRSSSEQFGFLSFVIRPDDPVLMQRLAILQRKRDSRDDKSEGDGGGSNIISNGAGDGDGAGGDDSGGEFEFANKAEAEAEPVAPLSKKAKKRKLQRAEAEAREASKGGADKGDGGGDDEAVAALLREKKRLKQVAKRERKQRKKLEATAASTSTSTSTSGGINATTPVDDREEGEEDSDVGQDGDVVRVAEDVLVAVPTKKRKILSDTTSPSASSYSYMM